MNHDRNVKIARLPDPLDEEGGWTVEDRPAGGVEPSGTRGSAARYELRPLALQFKQPARGAAATPVRARPRALKLDSFHAATQLNPPPRTATPSRFCNQSPWPLRSYASAAGDGRAPGEALLTSCPTNAEFADQIAKSLYSGFTDSLGVASMPAATVALVPGSIRMNEPVSRLVV